MVDWLEIVGSELHSPKHVHVYKDRRQVAKIVIPDMRVLSGKVNRKLRKVIEELIAEGKI